MNAQAFLSYASEDAADGYINKLLTLLEYEISLLTGSPFKIWRDRNDLQPGMRWWDEISTTIETVYFFIPIVTSRYLQREFCRKEFNGFLERENHLGRYDLIIPIVYVDTPELNVRGADKIGSETEAIVSQIKARQYSSWVHLRLKPFDDPEVRREMNRIAVRVSAVLDSISERRPTEGDNTINEKRLGIRKLLQSLTERIDRTTFTREFRADLVYGILASAKEEVEKLSNETAQYEQDLSLGENFIVRAGPVFAEAEKVYAVSVDVYSGFWIAPDQQRRAEEYTSRQPPNTKRLFVFSSMETAMKYRNVLKAHYQQYGTGGGAVLLTTASRWHDFLRNEVSAEQLDNIINRDFAVLVYGHSPQELYLATLTETTLRLQAMATLQPFHWAIMHTFDRLAAAPEWIGEEQGIVKWRAAYGRSDSEWSSLLSRLFNSEERKTSVYHIVLFSASVDFPKLTTHIRETVQPQLMSILDPETKKPLIEDMWFGSRDASLMRMAPMDGKFGGRLVVQNEVVVKYPNCLVLKFRSTDDLKTYYEDPTHSEVRRQLFSSLDPTIAEIYGTLESLGDSAKKEVSGAIEQAAARIMLRADYLREGPSALAITPVPFALPERRKPSNIIEFH